MLAFVGAATQGSAFAPSSGAEALCFDARGLVTNKDEYSIGETDYDYDAEGQLTDVDYPSGASHAFTYDDNGNRTQWTRTDGPTTTYAYNAADQLTQSTEGTIGTTYTHDDNGNLTGETTGGVTKSFNYDAFNRLTSVTEGLASIQSMTYGPDGKRLSLTDSSGARKFFYDGNDVIQEYNSDWSAVRMEYTHGPWVDEPLSMTDHASREASDTHYLLKDRLGSIINILDENETVKTTYSYDAFGDPTATHHSGQVDCMYRFTGRVYDGAMGNYFYRARYYNQSLGRFFSRDPIFSLQSLYAYCNNSPMNFTDPSGMENCSAKATQKECEECCELQKELRKLVAWIDMIQAQLLIAAEVAATSAGLIMGGAAIGTVAGAIAGGAVGGGSGSAVGPPGTIFGGLTGTGIGAGFGGGIGATAGFEVWKEYLSEDQAKRWVESEMQYRESCDTADADYIKCTDSCKQSGSGTAPATQASVKIDAYNLLPPM
ncbi:MAG: hypothetical protein JW941_07580 [Candidatus Coatesbacteria bacterium]|nr:hypothetical protein [Candidatus Coatesbacteria bacterium]